MSITTPIGVITEDGRLVLPSVISAQTLRSKNYRKLKDPLPEEILVDCSQVEECDSTAIAALIWLLKEVTRQNKRITWQNMPEQMRRLVDLYDLNHTDLIHAP